MTTALEPADVERFRSLIEQRLGLSFDEGKLGFLNDVLRRRLDSCDCTVDLYLGGLALPEVALAETRALAHELTVPETYFFRNMPQLRAFAELVLPALRPEHAAPKPLRILSAGCASGEEAYSLAMMIRARWPGASARDVSIRGIDVNASVLAKAREARYSRWSFRETSAEMQMRWFRTEGRSHVLDDGVRAMATFEEGNLAEETPALFAPESFDVVFCRNVLMYFKLETAREVVSRLARALSPGGLLFLGHAETLRGLSQDFHLRHTHGAFYYERCGASGARSAGPPADPSTSPFPLFTPPQQAAPAASEADPWMSIIRGAAERIQTLTDSPSRSREAREPRPAWDRGLALELLRQERFAEALALVRAMPPEAVSDPEVLLLEAVLLTHGGSLVEAEEVCRKLQELDETNAGAHYVMALCRENAGDLGGAAAEDQVAIHLDPTFAMPRMHLGLLARRAEERDAARRELGQALFLLEREDASRLLLFGGGFHREALIALCRAELVASGGAP